MLFVAFTVVGGFLAWLLPWLLLPHFAAALWGARMAITRAVCPLSRAENWGRAKSGLPQLHEEGFIVHYFEGRLYPASWRRRIVVVVASVVLGSWVGIAVR